MKNCHNALSKQNEYEKLDINEKVKHENKIVRNIKYNSELLFKYVKLKTKIHKNVSTIKKMI